MLTILKGRKKEITPSPRRIQKLENSSGLLVLLCRDLFERGDYFNLSWMEEELSCEASQKAEVKVYPHFCQNLDDLGMLVKLNNPAALLLAPCFRGLSEKKLMKERLFEIGMDPPRVSLVNLKQAWRKSKKGHSLIACVLESLRKATRELMDRIEMEGILQENSGLLRYS